MKHEHRETHHEESQYHTDQRGQHDKDGNLEYPGSNQSVAPEREPYRTDQSPDQSVGHTDRHTEMSTQPNPDHRTDQSCQNKIFIDFRGIHDSFAHRVSHAHPKNKDSGKVPKCCPANSHRGRKYTCRHDRSDRIGRIIHSVQKVEKKSDHNS